MKILFKTCIIIVPIILFGIFLFYAYSQEDLHYNLDFEVPVSVKNVVLYREDGTIGVVIVDGKRREFSFCLEKTFIKPSESQSIYLGVVHPSLDGARRIKIGALEEKVLMKVLEKWMRKIVSEEKQAEFLRNKSLAGFSDEEVKAYWVLQVLRVLWYR